MACLPVQIAGRNRVWRKLLMDAIRDDPDWKDGEYKEEPKQALRTAQALLAIAGSAPLLMQKNLPTQQAADKYVADSIESRIASLDANDLLYQVDASRDYDPQSKLANIRAPLLAVNSADDQINPPELGILEREIKNVPHGRAVVIPISEATHGHGTHTYAAVWKDLLVDLLKTSATN